MASTELLNYVRSQIAKGVPEPAIIDELRSKQWEEASIQEAMAELRQPMGGAASVTTPAQPMAEGAPADLFDEANMAGGQPQIPMTQPTAETPVMAMPAAAMLPTTSGGGRSKLGLIIGIVVAAVLVLGGGAAAGYFFWYQAPDRIAAQALENLSNLESVQFSATITPELKSLAKLTPLTPGAESVSIVLAGRSSVLNPGNPMASFTANVNTSSESGQESFGLEVRSLDSVVYFRPVTSAVGPIDFSFLEDRWVKYDPAELQQAMAGLLPEELVQQVESQQNAELTAEEVAQVKQAFRDSAFVTVASPTGEAEIYGTQTKGYPATIDAEKLVAFFQSVRGVFEEKGVPAEQVDELITKIADVRFPTVTLWIGTDKQIYRITGTVASASNEGQVQWTVDLWNHNQAFTVEAPTETIDLMTFVGEAVSALYGIAPEELPGLPTTTPVPEEIPAEDTDVVVLPGEEPTSDDPVDDTLVDDGTDTDGDGLTDLEEAEYGTDPENEDSDNDTYLDGEEVESGYDPAGPGQLTAAGAEERDQERISELQLLQTAVESYFTDKGRYPAVGDDWQDLGDALSPYTQTAQADPEHPTKAYTYFVSADGSAYVLRADLEDTTASGLALDVDGDVGGKGYDGISSDDSFQQKKVSCDDPTYCVGS